MKFTEQFENYKFNNYGVRLPVITISEEERLAIGSPSSGDNYVYLSSLCWRGFEKRVKQGKIPEKEENLYIKRYEEELETFKKLGLVDYILLVYDVLSWCDKNGIARGVARGSSSASLVLYLLNCTNINPILHNLYFTRFISEARAQSKVIDGITYVQGSTLCDIDSDVSYRDRGRVMEYIDTKYKGKTSKISTQARLTGKILIKECAKIVLNYTEEQAKRLADMIGKHFGNVESMDTAYKNNKEFAKWADDHKECFEIAKSLEGLIKSVGQHPSGVAISFYDINDYIPLELSASKEPVTSYDMSEVANLLVKLDVLGLKNVDVNAETCKMIGIDINSIDINDKSIYDFLKVTDCYYGLFQIESGLGKNTVQKVKPSNIDELAACLSIGRPGAMAHIDKYVNYIQKGKLEPIHPKLDAILKDTANIIIYQESINSICQDVYKMSAIDADQVRYAIGKKKRDLMEKWEPVLYTQGKKNKIPEEVTKYFWETCNKSADYLFVKGHGYSYAYMTAINTYLKANHPKEFFTSLLRMAKNEPDPIECMAAIHSELKTFNIKLLAPSLLKSNIDFEIEGPNIRYGLGAIKNISDKTIEKLVQFKKQHANKFELFISARQSKIPIGVLSSMIQAGALDEILSTNRSRMVLEACTWNVLTEKEQVFAMKLGPDNNFDLVEILKKMKVMLNEKGKEVIKPSRWQTILRKYTPHYKIYQVNSQHEDLACYLYERSLLGYSHSHTLGKIFSRACDSLMSIAEIKELEEKDKCSCMGIVEFTHEGIARNEKKTSYLRVDLSDETGRYAALIFNNNLEDHKMAHNGIVKDGDIVWIRGTKAAGSIFAQSIQRQDHKVYLKLSSLKDDIEKEEKLANPIKSNIVKS